MTTTLILGKIYNPTTDTPVNTGASFFLTDSSGNIVTDPSTVEYFWIPQFTSEDNGSVLSEYVMSKLITKFIMFSEDRGFSIFRRTGVTVYSTGHDNRWTQTPITYVDGNIDYLVPDTYRINFDSGEGAGGTISTWFHFWEAMDDPKGSYPNSSYSIIEKSIDFNNNIKNPVNTGTLTLPTNINPIDDNDDYLVVPFLPYQFTTAPHSRFKRDTSTVYNHYYEIVTKSFKHDSNDYDCLPGIRIKVPGKYTLEFSAEISMESGAKEINFVAYREQYGSNNLGKVYYSNVNNPVETFFTDHTGFDSNRIITTTYIDTSSSHRQNLSRKLVIECESDDLITFYFRNRNGVDNIGIISFNLNITNYRD